MTQRMTHNTLTPDLLHKMDEHKQYIDEYGEDLPEIRNWKWQGAG